MENKTKKNNTETQMISNTEVIITTGNLSLDEESLTSGKIPVGLCNGENIKATITLPLENALALYQEKDIELCQLKVKLSLTQGIIHNAQNEYQISCGNLILYKGCLTNKAEIELDITPFMESFLISYPPIYALTIENLSYKDVENSEIENDYLYIYTSTYLETDKNPIVQFKYKFSESLVDDRSTKTYQMNHGGFVTVHLNDGSFIHQLELFRFKENALTLPLSFVFNSKLYDGSSIDPYDKNISAGFKTNFHQYLLKDSSDKYHKIYIDGLGYRHDFYEKWYYMKDDKKIYVDKKEVYLDYDQKLKYKDYEISFETKSANGMMLVSYDSLYNYNRPVKETKQKRYYIKLKDDVKKYVYVDENNIAHIPDYFYNITTEYTAPTAKNAARYDRIEIKENGVLMINDKVVFVTDDLKVELGEFHDGKMEFERNGIPETSEAWENPARNFLYEEVPEQNQLIENQDDFLTSEDLNNLDLKIENIEENIKSLKLNIESCKNTIANISTNKTYYFVTDEYSEDLNEIRDELLEIEGEEIEEENLQTIFNLKKEYNDINDKINFLQKSANMTINYIQRDEYIRQYYRLIDELSQYETLHKNMMDYREYLISAQKDAANSFIIDEDQNILGFDSLGRMVSIQDKYENTMNIHYEEGSSFKMIAIDSKDKMVSFEYDKNNRLSKITDPLGRTIRFNDNEGTKTVQLTDEIEVHYHNTESKFEITNHLNNRFIFVLDDNKVKEVGYLASSDIVTNEGKETSTQNATELVKERYTYQSVNNQKITLIQNILHYDEGNIQYSDAPFIQYEFDCLGKILNVLTDHDSNTSSIYEDNERMICCCNFKANHKLATMFDGSTSLTNNKLVKTYNLGELIENNAFKIHKVLGVLFKIDGNYTKEKIDVKVTLSNGNRIQKNTTRTIYVTHNGIMMVPFEIPDDSFNKISVTITFESSMNLENVKEIALYKVDSTRFIYDEKENVSYIQTGDYTYEYEYDQNDLVIRSLFTLRDGRKITTKYYYDCEGQLNFTEDSLGNCYELTYNQCKDLIEKKSYNKSEPNLIMHERYEYDELGNLKLNDDRLSSTLKNQTSRYYDLDKKTSNVNRIVFDDKHRIDFTYDYLSGMLNSISFINHGDRSFNNMFYKCGLLTKVSTDNMDYQYTYDSLGRIIEVNIKDLKYCSKSYEDHQTYDIDSTTYEDVSIVKTYYYDMSTKEEVYDDKGKLLKKSIGNDFIIYHYNEEDQLVSTESNLYELVMNMQYMSNGLLSRTDTNTTSKTFTYDDYQRVESVDITQSGYHETQTYHYSDDFNDYISKNILSSGEIIHYKYDSLGRMTKEYLNYSNLGLKHDYVFADSSDLAPIISNHMISINGHPINYHYTYDSYGRIVKITKDHFTTKYQYDSLGRLIREDNQELNKTFMMHYDNNGNILSKGTYELSYDEEPKELIRFDKFNYNRSDWGDQLISFNDDMFEYSDTGKPIKFRNKVMEWSDKGLIKYILLNENNCLDFTYQEGNGRTEKCSKDIYFKMQNDGDKVLAMTTDIFNNTTSNTIHGEWKFKYSVDKLIGFNYNGSEYIYVKNGLGDITYILDKDGNIVSQYVYDAWGNHKVLNGDGTIDCDITSIGNVNPFRYRGYFYDIETQLYWVSSRYYSPELCRWISPDSIEYLDPQSINGLNLYCYCYNNPIMYVDPSGHMPEWLQWTLGGLIVVGAIALSICTAGLATPIATAVGGGLFGAIVGGAVAGAIGGAIAGFGISIGTQAITNGFENINWSDVGKSTASGAISGFIAGGLFGGIKYAYSAKSLANSVSGLSKAQSSLDNAWKPLSNVKNLANMPFSSANIARTVGQAAANYNAAYTNLIFAGVNNTIANLAFAGMYAGAQFGLKQLISYGINQIW